MIKFIEKRYTKYDQTDNLKQMKDSDILAEKKRSNSSLTLNTVKNTALGAGAGYLAGGVTGMFKKKSTWAKGGKTGALIGGVAAALASSRKNGQQREENNFYNNRLEYAQRQAKRREKKDWKNNMTNREGYTY